VRDRRLGEDDPALGLAPGVRGRVRAVGQVLDIAAVVGWLVSGEAGWVSRQTVRANGAMF
jgi:3-oxoacyl-[acyl-carrier protein] reductase